MTQKRKRRARVPVKRPAPMSDTEADATDPPVVLLGIVQTKEGWVLAKGAVRLSQVADLVDDVDQPDQPAVVMDRVEALLGDMLWGGR